jgi:hypothetical protein
MVSTGQEGKRTVSANQEEVKTMMSAIWSAQTEFEEIISKWVKSILVSVNQQTHIIHKKQNIKIQGT